MIIPFEEIINGAIQPSDRNLMVLILSPENFSIFIQSQTNPEHFSLQTHKISGLRDVNRAYEQTMIEYVQSFVERFSDVQHFAVIVEPTMYTLIPTEFYEPHLNTNYLKFLTHDVPIHSFAVDAATIQELNAMLVYAYPAGYRQLISFYQHKAVLRTPIENMLSVLLRSQHVLPVALVRIKSTYADVFVADRGQLLVANRFNYMLLSELQYFIQHAVKSVGLKSSETQLFITGAFTFDEQLTTFMLTHFYSLRLLHCPCLFHSQLHYQLFDALCHTFES